MNTILVALFLVSAALVAGQDPSTTTTTTTTTTTSPIVPCGTRTCDTTRDACLNGHCLPNHVITQCQTAGSGTLTDVVKGKGCQDMCYGETANVTINANGRRCHKDGRDKKHHHHGHHDRSHEHHDRSHEHHDRSHERHSGENHHHRHHGICVNGVCK